MHTTTPVCSRTAPSHPSATGGPPRRSARFRGGTRLEWAVLLAISAATGCEDGGSVSGETGEQEGGTWEPAGTESLADAESGAAPPDDVSGCDPFEQDCPEGQKCMPYSADGDQTWNGLRCSSVAAQPKGLGEPCTASEGPVGGVDDCAVGLMCWGIEPGQTEGRCVELCTGSVSQATCTSNETFCSVYNDGSLPICLPSCDPLGNDCPPSDTCIPQGGGSKFVCAVDASEEGGAYGDPCLAFNKCNPGLYCAPSSVVPGCSASQGCCTQFCDLSDADPDVACEGATGGQECVPWYTESPPPGLEFLGGCAVP